MCIVSGDSGPTRNNGPHIVDPNSVKPIRGDLYLDQLDDPKKADDYGPKTSSRFVNVENYLEQESFEHGHQQMMDANLIMGAGVPSDFQKSADRIRSAAFAFDHYLKTLDTNPNWRGNAAQAATKNGAASLNVVHAIHRAARRMHPLVDAFIFGVNKTSNDLNAKFADYDLLVNRKVNGDHAADEALKEYNLFAQNILARTHYRPTIESIRDGHPELSGLNVPGLGGGGTPTSTAGTGGTGGGKGGGPITPSGLGSPDMPGFREPDSPAVSPTGPPSSGSGNPAQAAGQAAQQAGQAAQQAGQQAQNAMGQGANAAKQALDQALNSGQTGLRRLPEGMLGLDPKGLNGAAKAGGSGAHGGGSGIRTPTAKPAAQMAPSTKAAEAAPISRASASSGGSPGAGAPAAGHRGGAAGMVHKANKALRNQKNGEEVAGQTEAVLPVVGGEISETAPSRQP